MIGIVYRVSPTISAASLPVAGLSLVVRQFQALRVLGASQVVVEHSADTSSEEIEEWLVDQALTRDVVLVASAEPLGALGAAERGGVASGEVILAVAEDILFDADVRSAITAMEADPRYQRIELAAPACGGEGGAVWLATTKSDLAAPPTEVSSAPGWARSIQSLADALEAGAAALLGTLQREGEGVWPVQMHASEDDAGVWLSRGARIEPGARVTAPVLLGPDCLVRAGAEVGPNAFLGRGVVIEPNATVRDAIVFDDTVIGEGIRIERTGASPLGLIDLASGERFDIDDPALLAGRARALQVRASARAAALALTALLLVPALLLAIVQKVRGVRIFERERVRLGRLATNVFLAQTGSVIVDAFLRLLDVVGANRTLVGVGRRPESDGTDEEATPGLVSDASAAAPGALLIDDALAPRGASASTRLRAMAWYGLAKSWRLDVTLLAKSTFGAQRAAEV